MHTSVKACGIGVQKGGVIRDSQLISGSHYKNHDGHAARHGRLHNNETGARSWVGNFRGKVHYKSGLYMLLLDTLLKVLRVKKRNISYSFH